MIKLFKRRKKKDLREVCCEMYGDEFVEMYDKVNEGVPIGGFAETVAFINMVEKAKEQSRWK